MWQAGGGGRLGECLQGLDGAAGISTWKQAVGRGRTGAEAPAGCKNNSNRPLTALAFCRQAFPRLKLFALSPLNLQQQARASMFLFLVTLVECFCAWLGTSFSLHLSPFLHISPPHPPPGPWFRSCLCNTCVPAFFKRLFPGSPNILLFLLF